MARADVSAFRRPSDSRGGYILTLACVRSAPPRSSRRVGPRPTSAALHALSLRLETAREEERARVARELHDELGQVLTSLKLQFTLARGGSVQGRAEARSGAREPAAGAHRADRAEHSFGPRHLASDLRPPVLDHLGLIEAIKWEAEKFEARTGIRCRVSAGPAIDVPTAQRALALYRILQEALTNVVRHARAGAVRITLRQRGRTAAAHREGQRPRHREGGDVGQRIDRACSAWPNGRGCSAAR